MLLLQPPLHPWNSNHGPNARPQKRKYPAHHVRRIPLNRKHNHHSENCNTNRTNPLEKRKVVQHLSEMFTGLIPQIETLSEPGATGAVNGADVFDICVNSWAEGRTFGDRRDATGCGDAEEAEDIDEEDGGAEGKTRCGGGDGEEATGWIFETCAAVYVSIQSMLISSLGTPEHTQTVQRR